MFVPDLTITNCEWLPDEPLPFTVDCSKLCLAHVGWLDRKHPYTTGKVSDALLEKIAIACLSPVAVMRGYHPCEFCPILTNLTDLTESMPPKVERQEQLRFLGDAEIWIPSSLHLVFRAPTLIHHYVKDHGYLPPQSFLEAVDRFVPTTNKN
jgi:hypothetical protein